MKLQKINLEMKEAYYNFVNDWQKHAEEITPYSARMLDRTFEQFVSDANLYEVNPPEGWVKGTTLYLIEDANILGAINIRYELNEFLMNFGGHLGYGVSPSNRRRGLASKMLELSLPYLKDLNIKKVLITCDDKNIASAKVIENNGGVLENIVNEEGRLTRRYWLSIK